VEAYYEWIQKLAHGLQVATTYGFLTTVFRASVQSYLKIVIVGIKWSTLQHKEAMMLCQEYMTTAEARSALLVPHNTKQAALTKTQNNRRKTYKHCANCGMIKKM
jgi:hypothetical protein